jgi:glucan 1,3-beta-glucosidase
MKQLRGVNLGGWLVLERWMTPSLFEGLSATDEYTFCQELGSEKKKRLKQHRDTFITKADFEWIADHGLNAVRLPIGYWAFGSAEPYEECAKYIGKAMEWAKEYELAVIIDLHGAPGSQNGFIHSGKSGEAGWHANPENISRTVDVIGQIAEKYGKHPSLWGIELLNEPSRDIPLAKLQEYYRIAYFEARQFTDRRIIISDAYRPIAEWEDFIKSPDYIGLLLDVHLYQVFDPRDKQLSFDEHIAKTLRWKHLLETFGADSIIVGEWSAVLDEVYENVDEAEARRRLELYVETQRYAFANAAGQFYWSYKTEQNGAWSYRSLPSAIV